MNKTAPVTQRTECLTSNQMVEGSNPSGSADAALCKKAKEEAGWLKGIMEEAQRQRDELPQWMKDLRK